MSQEIVLTALITVAPGKWERMNELFARSFKYMQENEPGTLEFRVFQDTEGDGSLAVLFEKYAKLNCWLCRRSVLTGAGMHRRRLWNSILS